METLTIEKSTSELAQIPTNDVHGTTQDNGENTHVVKVINNLLSTEKKIVKDFGTDEDFGLNEHEEKCIVEYKEEEYIVFLIMDKESPKSSLMKKSKLSLIKGIGYKSTPAYDKKKLEEKQENYKGHDELILEVCSIRHRAIINLLNPLQKERLFWWLAETLVLVFENDYQAVKNNLENIGRYLDNRNKEIARKWHVLYSGLITAIIFALFGVIQFIGIHIDYFSINENVLFFVRFMPVGALGATMSIFLQGKKNIEYNCESGKVLNFLEISVRIVTGVVAALLAICLYKMDLLFSSLKNTSEAIAIIVLCFIVGFSERFIPSVVKKLEYSGENSDESD